MSAEEGEEKEGVPRRHAVFLIGTTGAATVASAFSLKYIVDNVLTPKNDRDRGFDGDGTPDGDQSYGDWRDEVPSGCELPESYAEDLEDHIYEIGMDGSRMNSYVESGRIAFEKDGTELGVLIDQDDDGQYDHTGNFEELCR